MISEHRPLLLLTGFCLGRIYQVRVVWSSVCQSGAIYGPQPVACGPLKRFDCALLYSMTCEDRENSPFEPPLFPALADDREVRGTNHKSPVVSLCFSEAPAPQAKSGCTDRSRFPSPVQTLASRARLASHSAFHGGPAGFAACWSVRLGSCSVW
jgi:hypothetical protein